MLKKRMEMKEMLKNQRGLTLIELLVVVVILGIIAAIAVVAIGNILENTERDAHIANAQQIANTAQLYYAAERDAGETVSLQDLYDGGYMTQVQDPTTGEPYADPESIVVSPLPDNEGYSVELPPYIVGEGNVLELDRDNVNL